MNYRYIRAVCESEKRRKTKGGKGACYLKRKIGEDIYKFTRDSSRSGSEAR
jgi:hypothetical protein